MKLTRIFIGHIKRDTRARDSYYCSILVGVGSSIQEDVLIEESALNEVVRLKVAC